MHDLRGLGEKTVTIFPISRIDIDGLPSLSLVATASDGKLRVFCLSLDDPLVILPGQVLELREEHGQVLRRQAG
jgi:hypothetical protein